MNWNGAAWEGECDGRWACPVCGKFSDCDDERSVLIPGDEPGSALWFCSAGCARTYKLQAIDGIVEPGYAQQLADGFDLLGACGDMD